MADERSRQVRPPNLMRPGRGHGFGAERPKDVKTTLRLLLSYLRPYRHGIILVFILAAFGTTVSLLAPYLMGRAIDQLVAHADWQALLLSVLMMLGAYVLAWGSQAGQGVFIATIAQRAMQRLRGELFSHLQQLSLKFHDERRSGELMSRLTNDMDAISRVLSQNVTQLFSGVLTIVGILIVMFLLNAWMALASMVFLPLMMALVAFVGAKTRAAFRSYQKNLGLLNGTLEETYSGQRVVMAFGQQERILSRFDRHNDTVRRVGIHAMTYALLVMPMMGILSNANIAVVAGLGGFLTVKGIATVGTIAAFITYCLLYTSPSPRDS